LDSDPELMLDELSDSPEDTEDIFDNTSLDEISYRILNRNGEYIHEFGQNHWARPVPPKGHTLYYQEMSESFGDPVTMAWFDLRTQEIGSLPLGEVSVGIFGDRLLLFSPTVAFDDISARLGEALSSEAELLPSRIIDRNGDVIFESSGMPSSFIGESSVFQISKDGKYYFARLPDGIFAGPFHRCLGFAEQRGLVLLDEYTFSYVDDEGTILSEDGFPYATLFHDGHAIIRRDGSSQWEVIAPDLATKAVIEGVDEVLRPTVGAIPFRRGEKWGYLDLEGTEKIPAQFDAIGDFVDGVALVLDEMTIVLINEAGDRIRESTLPSYEIPELPPFPGPDPFESRHDPDEGFGRDPFLEQRQRE
jgi:hypothetical protein